MRTDDELERLTGIKQPPPKTDLEKKIEAEIPRDCELPSDIDSGKSPDEG